MYKHILSYILTLCVALPLMAQSSLSPYTRTVLSNNNKVSKAPNLGKTDPTKLSTIIQFKSAENVDTHLLKSMGVTVNAVIGNTVTAQVPMQCLYRISALKGVRNVSLPRKAMLANDLARRSSFVNEVIQGTDLPTPFTGKGVVIGVVDCGFDYNHINFQNADGSTRIARVYMPHDTLGTAPIINGNALPGSEYTTPDQIKALTTDITNETHGTHTAGTAAGSYSLNGLQGVAPESELVLCGLDSMLYDNDIINSVAYIFNYANSVGKPAVVNLSLASLHGPHDGTSEQCVAYDELACKSNIIVMSSGNFAVSNQYLNKKFTSTDNTLNTVFYNYSSAKNTAYLDRYADIWNNTQRPLGIRLSIKAISGKPELGITKDEVLATSDIYMHKSDTDTIYTWSSETDSTFAKYYDGVFEIAGGVNAANNRYNAIVHINAIPLVTSIYYPVISIIGKDGDVVDCWSASSQMRFGSFGYSDFATGTGEYSISDMATGYNSISVGAYTTRPTYVGLNGNTYSNPNATIENDICRYSSYGTAPDGRTFPNVTAPGTHLISSFNSYDKSTYDRSHIAAQAESDGKTYYWYGNSGTSMSAPVVTGVIALWLQANPDLTPQDIKEILSATSDRDNYVDNGIPAQWGAGKINALAGIQKVLKDLSGIESPNAPKAMCLYPNPSDGIFTLSMPTYSRNLKVDIYSTNGTLSFSRAYQNVDSNQLVINTNGSLPSGIYIVKAHNTEVNYTSQLVIR